MIIAVEDVLSEVVVTKVLRAVRPELPARMLAKKGREYIRSRAKELNRTAQSVPVFILVDLDRPEPCPADLISDFLVTAASPNLLFRVAVMEIESWIMADRDAFAHFLAVPSHRIPTNTDTVAQPKEFVVNLARRSRRKDIQDDLVPESGSTAAIGRAFNARMAGFVAGEWNFLRAVDGSPSLCRMVERLRIAFR
jgi:hypothetical protein